MISKHRAAQLVSAWISDPVDALRRAQRRREAAQRYAVEAEPDHRHELAREAERLAAQRLRAMGYAVETTGHRSSYDLLIDGALRIEVKASLWAVSGGRGRYQANVRNRADLVLFLCRSGRGDVWFVLPASAAGRSVTIRTFDSRRYTGKYAQFRDRWGLVAEALAAVEGREIQTNFLTNRQEKNVSTESLTCQFGHVVTKEQFDAQDCPECEWHKRLGIPPDIEPVLYEDTPTLWECKNGHEFSASYNQVANGFNCPECERRQKA